MAKSTESRIYQVKVTLQGVKPPVWRRLLVQSSISLRKLHDVLQDALGWTDAHLHLFDVRGQTYGVPDPDFANDMRSDAKVQLDQMLVREKDAMFYDYDFGDGWRHKIVLEKIVPPTSETRAHCALLGLGPVRPRTSAACGVTQTAWR